MNKRQAEKIVTRIHCNRTRKKYIYGKIKNPLKVGWYFFIREIYNSKQICEAYKSPKGKRIIERAEKALEEAK